MTDEQTDWMNEDELETVEALDYALPLVMSQDALESDAESLDDLFAGVTSRLSESETESFGSAMRQVGQWFNNNRDNFGQIANTVLPVAGTAIGAVYGGPVGSAIGKGLGERAGQAIAGGKPRPAVPPPPARPGAPQTPATPPVVPTPTPPTVDGSQAAAQLLYLVQNPAFLSSLISLAIGSKGRPSITTGTGESEIPIGAFVNAASTLANEAAEDADALVFDGEVMDSYLRDDEGSFICDPAVPSERARSLLQVLQREDESMYGFDEANDDEFDSAWDEFYEPEY